MSEVRCKGSDATMSDKRSDCSETTKQMSEVGSKGSDSTKESGYCSTEGKKNQKKKKTLGWRYRYWVHSWNFVVDYEAGDGDGDDDTDGDESVL